MYADTQTDVLPGEPESAICVQRFDDSLNSAIHTTYRSWLRSSSMHEPRDPPLKVVSRFGFSIRYSRKHVYEKKTGPGGSLARKTPFVPLRPNDAGYDSIGRGTRKVSDETCDDI